MIRDQDHCDPRIWTEAFPLGEERLGKNTINLATTSGVTHNCVSLPTAGQVINLHNASGGNITLSGNGVNIKNDVGTISASQTIPDNAVVNLYYSSNQNLWILYA